MKFIYIIFFIACSNGIDDKKMIADFESYIYPKFVNAIKYEYVGYLSTDNNGIEEFHFRVFLDNDSTILILAKQKYINNIGEWGLLSFNEIERSKIQTSN